MPTQDKPKALIVGKGKDISKKNRIMIDRLTELGYDVTYQDFLEEIPAGNYPISHIWFDEWSKTE